MWWDFVYLFVFEENKEKNYSQSTEDLEKLQDKVRALITWDEQRKIFTCANKLLKQKLPGKFAIPCSTLVASPGFLEAGSTNDMPLLIQITVFCHLQQNSTLLDYRLSELRTTRWVQMGRSADVPGSRQSAQRGAAPRSEGGEGTTHGNRILIAAKQLIWLRCGTKGLTDCTCSAVL